MAAEALFSSKGGFCNEDGGMDEVSGEEYLGVDEVWFWEEIFNLVELLKGELEVGGCTSNADRVPHRLLYLIP